MPYKANDETRAYYRELQRAKYARQVRMAYEILSSSACAKCGNTDIRVLDFHHRNPAEKHDRLSAMYGKVSDATLLAEINKCEILCSNCHRIESMASGMYSHKNKFLLEKFMERHDETEDEE